MSLVERCPSMLMLRFSLGFPCTGCDRGPMAMWVGLQKKSRAPLVLQPLRLRPDDGAAEWYLAEDEPLLASVAWLMSPTECNSPGDSPCLPVEGAIRLTLGEIARYPGQDQDRLDADQYALTGGSVTVALHAFPAELGHLLPRLWPTRNARAVSRIHCEPSGLHLEGRLPATFFAGPANGAAIQDEQRTVVLRLPRDTSDFAAPNGTLAPVAEAPSGAGSRPFWTLTNHPFHGAPTSSRIVQDWFAAVGGFALTSASTGDSRQRTLHSFVDSVSCEPEESSIVGVFGVDGDGANGGLSWFAHGIGARVNLGGGSAAEAAFLPERIRGRAGIGRPDWFMMLEGAASTAAADGGDHSPSIRIELSQPDRVQPEINAQLQPVSAPMVRVEGQPEQGGETTHRLWLCLESGWASIDAAPCVAVDPANDSEGAIRGVLEVDKLLNQLQPSDRALGLSIQAKALAHGAVAIQLKGVAAHDHQLGMAESLTLSISDPLLMVMTPPVFYCPPGSASQSGGGQRLSPLLPALTVGAASARDSQIDLAEFERILTTERFQGVVFVSDNVTKPLAPTDPPLESLVADLVYDGSTRAFAMKLSAHALTVWHRPSSLPIARTYPLDPDQALGAFLDANRGLIPLCPRDAGARHQATFRFDWAGMPSLTHEPLTVDPASGAIVIDSTWRIAEAANRGGSQAYFLPTLPGLELDPTPAMNVPSTSPQWVYRHGVPVLDEEYSIAVEARRDSTSPSHSEKAPRPGDLPPGFDPTRVVDAEAFRFTGESSNVPRATGWLPRTEANPSGALPLGDRTASLAGRSPALHFTLGDGCGGASLSVTFSREEGVEGLTGHRVLRIEPPDEAATDLPSFIAGLAPAEAPTAPAYDDDLGHNGVPLLAATVGGRIVTHDALGTRHEEPSAPGLARIRRLGSAAPSRRLSLQAELSLGAWQLEALGIELDEAGGEGTVSSRQMWLLHDGQGRPANLAGFPLHPVRLTTFSHQGEDLVVGIEVVVGLTDPRAEMTSLGPRDSIAPPGTTLLTLLWKRPLDRSDAVWTLVGATGAMDWRFQANEEECFSITRLVARFDGPAATPAGPWNVTVTSLEFATPGGPLTFDALSVPAVLENARLTLGSPLDHAQGELMAHIDPFVVDRGSLGDSEMPTWPGGLKYRFCWSKKGTCGLAWTLRATRGQSEAADGWGIEVKRGTDVLIDSPLKDTVASPGRLLLQSAAATTPLPSLPAGSWFHRTAPDLILAGAVFRSAEELSSLTSHILLHLEPGSQSVGLCGELAARLSIEASEAEASPILTASGWLTATNQLPLVAENGPITHTATMVAYRAPWTVDALFFGIGPADGDQDAALPVEHKIICGGRTVQWQVVQPVRLRRAEAFAKSYLDDHAVVAHPERLTLDLGWVWWLRLPAAPEPAGLGGGCVLESPHLKHRWCFRARPQERGRFDSEPAYVARLPFGFAGEGGLPSIPPIQLSQAPQGNRVIISSGAGARSTIMPLRSMTRADAGSNPVPTFERGGPDSGWLDPANLAAFFGDADRTQRFSNPSRVRLPLLPAYEGPNNTPTTKLPDVIGDWAWLFERIAGFPTASVRLAAASLRTPYVPRSKPAPLANSALLELPFTFFTPAEGEASSQSSGDCIDVQLLGFIGGMLRLVRRAGLKPDEDPSGDAVLTWAREVVAAGRRDEGVLVLRDFDTVIDVGRPFETIREEYPVWSAAPLAAVSDPQGRPPVAQRDPRRCRPADGATDRVVPVASEKAIRDVPEYYVFAARPEIPSAEQRIRSIAATRFRLALSGRPDGSEPRPGCLHPARVARAAAGPANLIAGGALFGWTKAEETPFQVAESAVNEATPWQVFPTPGPGPHARRDPLIREWNRTGEIVTVAPPLIDAVVWARRPGELTRSLVAGYRAGYPDSDAVERIYEDTPAIGQEIVLRRPRAKASPFERVTINPIQVQRLLAGQLQYTRLRLTQTIGVTSLPDPGEAHVVLTVKSDVHQSAPDLAIASSRPAMLEYKENRGEETSLQKYGFYLVARKDFAPGADFATNGAPMIRTVLFAQVGGGDLPDEGLDGAGPPIVDREAVDPDGLGRVVLFGLGLPAPDPTHPQDGAWKQLFDDVYTLDVLEQAQKLEAQSNTGDHRETRPTVVERLRNLLVKAAKANKPVYLVLATYARTKTDSPWKAPGAPRAVMQVNLLNAANALVKPRMGVALLHAPKSPSKNCTDRLSGFGQRGIAPGSGIGSRTDGRAEPPPESYCLAGFGRLDDDDFGPTQPMRIPADTGQQPPMVGWGRAVELQSIERLSAEAAGEPNAPQLDSPAAASAFAYDVVFYGPGGELIPTDPSSPV